MPRPPSVMDCDTAAQPLVVVGVATPFVSASIKPEDFPPRHAPFAIELVETKQCCPSDHTPSRKKRPMSSPVLEQIAETCWSSPAPRLAPASLAETGRQTPVMECPETTTMNPLPSGGKSGLVTSVYEYLLGIWTCLICLTEDGNPLSSQSLAAIFSFVTARNNPQLRRHLPVDVASQCRNLFQ